MKKIASLLIVFIIFGYSIISNSIFTVEDGEQVILTRFGKIVKSPITKPGYHFKIGFIEETFRCPSKEIMMNIKLMDCPRIPGNNVMLNFIIIDPAKYYETVYKIDHVRTFISKLLKEKYCNKKINEESISSISSFVEGELSKRGISTINLNFSG